MKIDLQTGSITLPSGFELRPDLKIEEFRASGLCEDEDVYNPGTPWYYHKFLDGKFEGQPLAFSVCLYQNPNSHQSALTNCSFSVSYQCQMEAEANLDSWSPDAEAKTLGSNRRLIEQLLGNPHYFQRNMTRWEDFPLFRTCACYDFAWGEVWCGSEDIKTNIVHSDISLRYESNFHWAAKDYQKYRKSLSKTSFWQRWKRW